MMITMVKKNRGKNGEKGQAISIDFFFAIIVVLIVIGMATTSWNRTVYLIEKNTGRRWMRRTGLAVADMMIRSPGVPSDWNSSSVMTIGLVDTSNVLNRDKITEFNSMPKSKIQQLLGIGGYDFSFRDSNVRLWQQPLGH
jgi:hypothetical protein